MLGSTLPILLTGGVKGIRVKQPHQGVNTGSIFVSARQAMVTVSAPVQKSP